MAGCNHTMHHINMQLTYNAVTHIVIFKTIQCNKEASSIIMSNQEIKR